MIRIRIAVVLLVIFGVLAYLVRAGPLPGDPEILRALASDAPIFALVSQVATLTVWIPLVLAVAAALSFVGAADVARPLVVATLSAEVVSLALKELIGRPRPGGVLAGDLIGADSFPSNSVLRVVVAIGVVAVVVSWRWPRWKLQCLIATVVLAALVGVARVAVGEHWPSDVVGGYLLATAWVLVAAHLARPTPSSTEPVGSPPPRLPRVVRRE